MTCVRKSGWCKDSKGVTGKNATRREKNGSHRLRWLDDVYSELSEEYGSKNMGNGSLNRTEWASAVK